MIIFEFNCVFGEIIVQLNLVDNASYRFLILLVGPPYENSGGNGPFINIFFFKIMYYLNFILDLLHNE